MKRMILSFLMVMSVFGLQGVEHMDADVPSTAIKVQVAALMQLIPLEHINNSDVLANQDRIDKLMVLTPFLFTRDQIAALMRLTPVEYINNA